MAWRESSASGVKGHGFSTHRVKAKFEDLHVSLINKKWIFIVRHACICSLLYHCKLYHLDPHKRCGVCQQNTVKLAIQY